MTEDQWHKIADDRAAEIVRLDTELKLVRAAFEQYEQEATVTLMHSGMRLGECTRLMDEAKARIEFLESSQLAANINTLSKELHDAKAALEAKGEVVITKNDQGQCVAVTRQDDEGEILSVIWQAK